MPSWKKVVAWYGDPQLNSVTSTTYVSASEFRGPLVGTSSFADSASYAVFADTAGTASYSPTLGASLGSPTNNQVSLVSSTGAVLSSVTVNNVVSSSYSLSSSYAVTASYAESAPSSLTASYALTASSANDFNIRGSLTGSSANFSGNITGSNLLINNTITAQTLIVQVITSSTEFVTGSTIFGSQLTDTHQFTGSVLITGSLSINNVSYEATSASFDSRILANSSSISTLSSSFLATSASFDTRINDISGSYVTTASYLADSASFSTRITDNSSSIAILSGSYLTDSASFSTRITNNSSSIAVLSSSFLEVSASYASLSGSFRTGSYTGSFIGVHSGSFSGSFFGDGSGLTNISASSVVGLNLSQISSGSVTASVDPAYGFKVNSNTQISGSTQITGSLGVTGSVSITGSTGTLFTANVDTIILTGSLVTTGSIELTGSMNVLGGITSSLFGTASWAVSASHAPSALTSSYATTSSYALTASYVDNAQTASYVLNAVSASYATQALSASYSQTSSLSTTASYAITAAYASNVPATASYALEALSSSYALTASYALNAGGTGISAIYIADEGSVQGTASFFDFTGAGVSATVTNGTASINIPGGGGGGSAIQGAYSVFTQSVAATTWSISHAVNSKIPVVEVYDSSFNVIIPTRINNPGPFNTNIYFDVAQSGYAIVSTGGDFEVTGSNAILNQNVAATTWSFQHDLQTQYPVFTIFDSNNDVIIPQRINAVDTASAVIYFSSPRTGKAVASVAAPATFVSTSSLAVTASYALTASYVQLSQTASYVQNAQTASYVLNAVSSSFATTASYTLQSLSSSYAVTASHAQHALTSSYALTASFAQTAASASNAADITVFVQNNTGVQINKGSVVRISGAVGDNPQISLADWTNDQQSANTMGLAMSDIANGGNGYVLTEGKFIGYDTSTPGWTAGQLIFLGPSGSITGSAPQAPLHGVRLGQVLRIQQNNGSMYIRVDNGYELGELHDVVDTTTTASYGDLFVKSGSVWHNSKQLTGSYGLTGSLNVTQITGSDALFTGTITAQTLYVQTITSSTEFITGSTKFGSQLTDTHQFTGSVTITGSLSVNDSPVILTNQTSSMTVLSSSFASTASYTSQALSSSYALTASFALNGGGGGISAVSIADEGTLQGSASYFDFTGAGVTATVSNGTASINITGTGGGGQAGLSTTFTQSVAADPWTFIHNLNTRTPLVQVYDTSYNQITPQYVSASNANTVIIGFGVATAGYAIASNGGTIVVTGSNVILNQSVAATTWSFDHNLNTQYPIFQVFNSADEVIIPEKIVASSITSSFIYFPTAIAGKAVASVGGLSGSISASYAIQALTASYAMNAGGGISSITIADEGTLIGTASYFDFIGNNITASVSNGTASITVIGATGTSAFTQSTAAATWSFVHNLNTFTPLIQAYTSTYNQLIPNEIVGISPNVAEIRFDYSQSGYAVASNGGPLTVSGSTARLNQNAAAVTWSFAHNLNSQYVNFEVYDSNNFVIIPANIKAVDSNNAELYFATPSTGVAIAMFSGINGAPNAVSASFATTASYAATASYLNPVTSGYVVLTQVSSSLNYVDDAAAAAGGVPLGGLYRNGNFIMIRIV